MKLIILLCFLPFAIQSFSQENIELGLTGSIEKSFNTQQESHNQFQIDLISGGLTIDFKTKNKHLLLGSGLIYDRYGYYQFHSWESNNKNFIYYEMDYLTVPLKVSGSFGEKFFIRGSTGLNISVLVNSQSYLDTDPTNKSRSNTGAIETGVFAQIGGGYHISEHFGIHLHADLVRGLTAFDQDYFGWLKHKKRGISLALLYKF